MQVKYAVMPTSDIGKLGTYKDLDVLVDTHGDTQFTPKLDADQIQIPPQRVLVISGGYKSIKYAFAQFNSKRIGLLITNHTGPATIQLQIGYKKNLTEENMTYVVIGRSGEFWNIAPICTNTYNYTNNAPALGVEALQEQLDNAYAQRDQ